MRYAPYSKYKPSGVEWLGDVPEHWEVKRVKTAASYRVSNVDKLPADDEQPVRLCNYTDVYYNDFITPDMELMETTATPDEIARFRLHQGDVVITKDSEEWDDIAVPALVKESAPDLLCGYHLAFIRPNPKKLAGSFLFRCFQAEGINQQFQVAASGVTRYGLPKSSIGSAWIPVPPHSEQEQIAAFVEQQTAKIDALIGKRRALIDKLKEKRTALISRAVTRGLPPVAAKLNPRPKLKHSGVKWLGEIPEHWEVKRVKNLGSIRYGLGEPPEYVNDGIPFIRATDIKRGKIELELVRRVDPNDIPWSRRPQLVQEEILVVRSGAYTGDSAIVTKDVAGNIAGYDMVITVQKGFPRFVAWVLLSKYMLQGQIHISRLRAAQPHLNAQELGGFIFLVPPTGEQRAIADYLNNETTKIDQMVEKVEAAIEKLQEYRTALITAAVTGKIDVRKAS